MSWIAGERDVLVAGRIASEELDLTPLRQDDAEAMVVVLRDPELYAFIGGTPPTIDELRQQYARQAGGVSPDGSQWWLNWIVRVAGEPVGYVQATVEASEPVAELAWVIGTPWQGRGLAGRSAGMVKQWLSDRGVDGFTASIHPEHYASAAVAARLGLQPSGLVTDDGESIWQTPRPTSRPPLGGASARSRRPDSLELGPGHRKRFTVPRE